MNPHHKRTTCRACGGENLEMFLSLGPTPLANTFPRSRDEFATESSFPLDVYFCRDCALVQLLDVIDPEVLFRDYIYVSGTSDTLAAHHAAYARAVVDLLRPTPEEMVVEVASNDGNLLRHFRDIGVRSLGIEPASNLAETARARGIDTLNVFFNSATARELRQSHGPAKAIIGNNVLAHVDNTIDFLSGAAHLLASDGLLIVEVPYLRDLLDHLEYDTVYHEHLCYFSVLSLMRLYAESGLSIVRVDRVPIHGGSIRVFAAPRTTVAEHAPQVLEMAAAERAAGLDTIDCYRQFAARVEENRRQLCGFLGELRGQGKSVAAYGAPAKGNTLLNYCGIDTSLVAFTVDKNPMKVGRYTPGVHLPVLPVTDLKDKKPDYVLILAWNFAEEIMRQQQDVRAQGGRFITPIPAPQVN